MRFVAAVLFAFSLCWPVLSPGAEESSPPSTQAEPSPKVESHDIPEDDEEEDETPWALYGLIGGFVLFAAIVFLVISRADRSGKV